jgi:hypothetical protein
MLRARRYVCDGEGTRAAAIEAEPGGVVPSEAKPAGYAPNRHGGCEPNAREWLCE